MLSASGRHHGMVQNSLSGAVRTLDGKPVRNARVELRTVPTGQTIVSAYTLPNGTFEFSDVAPGVYEVVATFGVDEARQRVELYQPDPSVQLTLSSHQADSTTAGSATVSVAQMKVPDKARKLFQKADQAFQKQKFQQAREYVQKALQAFPAYAQALTLRGILNLQDNKLDDARTDLEQAIKDDASYGMGYVVLGTTYTLLKRFDDSVRTLERGIALSPSSWQGYFELSKAYLGKGQFPAAVRQIDKAAQLAPPDYSAIHLVRAHALLGVKDYNQAVAELEQFLGSNPTGADSALARDTLNQVKAFMASSGK